MQEGDVQIKGYPVRLPLDVALVFSANPEDYTARGKIVTPLKDRIGSEVRTHYPSSVQEGIEITAQEAWTKRSGLQVQVPRFIHEVIEQIAFVAREDKHIDKRSGVSQRLPISAIENVISNAERRAVFQDSEYVVPRIADVFAALPSITGKLELEYEGEVRGADQVVREIIKVAIARIFDQYFANADLKQVVQWFELGGEIQLLESANPAELVGMLHNIQGLLDKISVLKLENPEAPEVQVSAAEFVLEGLHAHKKIGRSEERLFSAGEKGPKPPGREYKAEVQDDFEARRRNRRPFN
jgi:magnesium chelatase subunit I